MHCHKIEILNLFDTGLQLINTKPMIINKLKEMLSALKKFKAHAIFVLEYNKRNDHKMFHSITKLIVNNTHIEEAFKIHALMHRKT